MTQPTLATRIALVEHDVDRHERRLDAVQADVKSLTSRLDVLGAKLAVYAAIGACLGGGLVAGVVRVVFG